MDRKKLEKLQRELDGLRARQIKAVDLQSLAKSLGRDLKKGGKHPMWQSQVFSHLFPLSIPDHGGKDLSHHVKKCSLDLLQLDIDAWDEKLTEDEGRKNESSNGSKDTQ